MTTIDKLHHPVLLGGGEGILQVPYKSIDPYFLSRSRPDEDPCYLERVHVVMVF